MDIQTRKIQFIQEFLKLESEKAISHLEKLLKKEVRNNIESEPMSIEDYRKRIDDSIEDSKNGRMTEADDLLSDIQKWS